MRRSDSWWTRFSRTNFLDRRSSNGSRLSRPLPGIRDPQPPPRLLVIEESEHPVIPELVSPKAGKSSTKTTSGIYNAHNKSLTSVKTADTEALERMAGGADVQIIRSGSHLSTSSDDTASSLHQARPHSWNRSLSEDREILSCDNENVSTAPSPGFSDEHGLHVDIPNQPEDLEGREEPSPITANTPSREVKERTSAMTVRLIQRPSLFIANPDHRLTPSNDTS